ncbi:uncharacterized protein EAF02_011934 [Botrytis sinoallii]|uniref:uncharacterized protein n=1 Tax=Botrytis sinoallii TaxID=1463999 RepID=UPI0018FF29A2|nr:uncharacterized protein EAF02_011934 [Botrytis sinoallii]KAF7853629.1 hypothetical protein EAF02_011934 [Botrytis sinoallii]
MVFYEIEGKFAFNPALLARFRKNQGQPPFRRLTHERTESFEDEYFDSGNLLSKSGVWIRKRDKSWEAKIRRNGDFLRSSYYETNETDEIKRLVHTYLHVGHDLSPNNNFGLPTLYQTAFGNRVGEVELQAHQTAVALFDIDMFMQEYSWFFASGRTPKGKTTAYFEFYGLTSENAS